MNRVRKVMVIAARQWILGALLASLLVLVASCTARAQDGPESALKAIESAISRGDAAALIDRTADNVEVFLSGSSTLFSRSQAQYVLREFFRQHPPEQFAFSQPTRSSASLFASGNYIARSNERLFQVYVRLRVRDGVWEAREIRIERRDRAEER